MAVFLRCYHLGTWPPGFYRDEAFNGLDAVQILKGQHALYFPQNNGREPLYIYLTALAISILGQSVVAVRLAAALVGSFTTLIVYGLGRTWFGPRVAILATWIWAITFWPIHLSRIGFRTILSAPFLAATFWVGTIAYRRQQPRLWFLTGLIYGASFYTYLSTRFTPILLLILGIYLLNRRDRTQLWSGFIWFTFGTILTLLPLLSLSWQDPSILLGRTGQVSILNEQVNNGRLWQTAGQHIMQAIGMFLWRGDTILRHNAPGRPVFDLFMALPFLIGTIWCLRHWRQPAATTLLLWTTIMLGPTILAEDTPHFLRASGILPGVIFLPALGLAQWSQWSHLPLWFRHSTIPLLLGFSLLTTISDYRQYAQDTEVAYLFEAAVTDMAQQINQETANTTVFIEQNRYWQALPALRFLVPSQSVIPFHPQTLPPPPTPPATLYVWPHDDLNFIPQLLLPPTLLSLQVGSLARGDLETTPYAFYLRYHSQPLSNHEKPLANFDNQLELRHASLIMQSANELTVTVAWQANKAIQPNLVTFIHVVGPTGLLTQVDTPPLSGYWQPQWWQPGIVLQDQHTLTLPLPFDPNQHYILIGLYDAASQIRLSIVDTNGQPTADAWRLP